MPGKLSVNLGDQVNVRGTGRRWSGMVFSAVLVDIREEDDTVKLRFSDGGYKRYKTEELQNLLVDSNPDALEPYELFHEFYDPTTTEDIDNLTSLRQQIKAAVKKQDFEEAQKLKEKLCGIVQNTEKIKQLQTALVSAVHNDEFIEAQKIKKKLAEFQDRTPRSGASGSDVSAGDVLQKSMKRALGGGMAGATAMVLQVSSLMWMRTTMNYQYRYGTTSREAFRALYKEGGWMRFYRGYGPAMLQGPMSRFGDTAANTGMLAYLNANPSTQQLPTFIKTAAASAGAATWRIFLMPLDTIKTTMQVEGKDGFKKVMGKVRTNSPFVLYHGGLAASAATFAGHYPWFFTYNTLSNSIPVPEGQLAQLGRHAFMGFCSSFVSDTTSNSLRVIKTYRQTNEQNVSYPKAVKEIVAKDGVAGLFGRGLQTRIMANGVQGVMFSVLWKFFEKKFNKDQ